MTTMYADIAPVRIQQYLARTPRLRDMRGASAQLSAVTEPERLTGVLDGRAHINPDAGDSAGIIALIVDDPAQADAVIDDVLAYLRGLLPAAQFQAVCAQAPDYVQAIAAMRAKREDRKARLDLPSVCEFPFAAPCRLCGSAPAIGVVRLGPDETKRACADCTMRNGWDARAQGGAAERKLSSALGERPISETFDVLATLGAADTDRNHLATIYADGNGVGDFFEQLARTAGDGHGAVSQALGKHTFDALVHATRQITRDDDPVLCVVPHVVGGDDILVTVPADRAWMFTRTFLADLSARLAATAEPLGIAAPTVSAGIAIAHATYAFHLVVEEAAAGLRSAKREVAGKAASVQLHDVTVDGVEGRRWPGLRLDTIEGAAHDLDRLRAVPRSGQARLAEALTKDNPFEAARTLARRLERADTVEPFLPQQDGRQPVIDLAHALRIVRWWR